MKVDCPHNIDITIYEGAHHSFDREMELTTMENGIHLEIVSFQ